MMLTLLFFLFPTGDDGLDSVQDYVGVPPKPSFAPNGILSGQGGLHYGDVRCMPMHCMPLMQCNPYHYFNNMVQDNAFQPVKAALKDTSDTTAILLVFVSDDQMTSIEHVHIRLIIFHTGSQVYEPKSIPQFIQYIEADLRYTKGRQEASGSALGV